MNYYVFMVTPPGGMTNEYAVQAADVVSATARVREAIPHCTKYYLGFIEPDRYHRGYYKEL